MIQKNIRCFQKRNLSCSLHIYKKNRFSFLQISQQYDYIITGAGCAGLSLAVRMIQSGKFANKKILLADADTKNKNDRTWCFWEKQEGLFEPIVYTLNNLFKILFS